MPAKLKTTMQHIISETGLDLVMVVNHLPIQTKEKKKQKRSRFRAYCKSSLQLNQKSKLLEGIYI